MTSTSQHIRTVIVGGCPDFIRDACEWIESELGLIVVATAGNGFAAVVVVDVLSPDLVLIDVATPGMDGVDATRKLKARRAPPAVVWITRHASADVTETAWDAGADAVIPRQELVGSAECILSALGTRSECAERYLRTR